MLITIKDLVPQSIKNLYHFINALAATTWCAYPARRLTVIGVTGTDGKTTTSTLIYYLLKTAGKKVALVTSVAAYIGAESVDTGFHVTSPDPWPLQRLIQKIANQGFEYLVLEATSHGLDQHRLLGTHVTIGVLTNITHEHFDYHQTYARYVAAKAKLFQKARFAILNQDDQSFPLIKKHICCAKIIPYSGKNAPTFVKSHFPESYNHANAQAAITIAKLLNLTQSSIKQGIVTFPGVPGRMEEIKNNQNIRVIVDFAHTPNALKQALTSLKKTTTGKLIAVFGHAGKRDYTKRPLMGAVAAKLADEVVLTAEDPRGEDVDTINLQIKSGATTNHGHLHSIPDRKKAIFFAIHTLAHKGDTVVLLGKGHEKSLNLDGKTEIPWSDQEVAKEALAGVQYLSQA